MALAKAFSKIVQIFLWSVVFIGLQALNAIKKNFPLVMKAGVVAMPTLQQLHLKSFIAIMVILLMTRCVSSATNSPATAIASLTSIEIMATEVSRVFSQMFQVLLVFVGLVAVKSLDERPILVNALIISLVLFYMVMVLLPMPTLQPLRIDSILTLILIFVPGSVVTILAIMTILPTHGWTAWVAWLFLCAGLGYYNCKRLSQVIKNWIRGQLPFKGNCSIAFSILAISVCVACFRTIYILLFQRSSKTHSC